MTPQFTNFLLSSFYLFLDHKLSKKGLAFNNTSSRFYRIESPFNGVYTFAAPYQPFVSDSSIPGATVMTGVWVGNSFGGKGVNGLIDINYQKSQLYFDTLPTQTVSGSYSLKEYNLAIVNEQEQTILFETKYNLRPKVSETPTGIVDFSTTYPAVFIKENGSENKPFAFGGMDDTRMQVRVIMLWDSEFNRTAAASVIQDLAHSSFPLLGLNDMPFNAFGGLKSAFNYETFTQNWTDFAYISRVKGNDFNRAIRAEMQLVNPSVYSSFIDLEISYPRSPRL